MTRGTVRERIGRLWRERLSPLERILWSSLAPLSLIYGAAVKVRGLWWRLMAVRAPVAVVSVGNLTVGGSGKTPFTLFLANLLRSQGYRVAIVSRGYGRNTDRALLVSAGGQIQVGPEESGDEPLMLAHFFAGSIAVARRRIDAIKLLLAREVLDAILLDDGFQHLRLRRDLDIVLVRHPELPNQWTLPAGPLREPRSALRRAGAIVRVGVGGFGSAHDVQSLWAELRPGGFISSSEGVWRCAPLVLASRRVLAVCGIARPESFAMMLEAQGATITELLQFSDHHTYGERDWRVIHAAARTADFVITTEKDLVKLERLSPALSALYALHLEATMNERDTARLTALVCSRIDQNRAARDSQT